MSQAAAVDEGEELELLDRRDPHRIDVAQLDAAGERAIAGQHAGLEGAAIARAAEIELLGGEHAALGDLRTGAQLERKRAEQRSHMRGVGAQGGRSGHRRMV